MFKNLTIATFVLLAFIMTLKGTPKAVFDTVKSDLEAKGVVFEHSFNHIESMPLRPGLYGYNATMGAYAQNIASVIIINSLEWRRMTIAQKKVLVAHEYFHSVGTHHCYKSSCVMSGGNIRKWNNVPYDTMLDTLINHHYKIKL